MTIMIIEDNVKMRTLITKILESELPDIKTIILCDNGKKAIELYHKNNPDWIIMDVDIKNIDGLAATQRIIEINPAAKIIILSQYSELEYKRAAIELGALDCISKENLGEITILMSE